MALPSFAEYLPDVMIPSASILTHAGWRVNFDVGSA
jgi:hypothetical protein